MVVVKRVNRKGSRPPWARGLRSIAIDQRSGFKHLQEEMIFEPGTEYFVHKDESDGGANLVTDPLNYPSPKMRFSEAIGLKYPSPDVSLSIGTIVSADHLYLPSGAVSVEGQFIIFASTAQTASGELDFSNEFNSGNIVILQGI